MIASGTLEGLASKIGTALGALEAQLKPEQAVAYFEQLGTRFPESLETDSDVRPALEAASTTAGGFASLVTDLSNAEQGSSLATLLAAGLALIGQIGSLLDNLGEVAGQIDAKATSWSPLSETDVHAFTGGLAGRVIEDAILRRLETTRRELAAAATALGIVDRFESPVAGGDAEAPPAVIRRFQLARLTDALSNPTDYFKGLVGWGEGTFDPTALLHRLQSVLTLFTYNTVVDTSGTEPVLDTSVLLVRGNSSTTPPGIDVTLDFPIPDGLRTVSRRAPGSSSLAFRQAPTRPSCCSARRAPRDSRLIR